MKKHTLILLYAVFLITAKCQAATIYYEKDYQKAWCSAHGGIVEYKLSDNTRVDCLTPTHAIEFDFAKKWGESIGQALYYGLSTGKHAGIVLIMEHGKDDIRYLNRVNTVAQYHNITIWTMTPEDMKLLGFTPNKKK